MSNFGFHHLRVVNPYDVAFEGARSAVGAAEVLARAEKFETVAEAVADCSLVVGTTAVGSRDLQHSLQRLEAGAPLIRAHLASSNCALLFGSEKFGLSNKDMSHCHWLMHIPTREEHFSMNLGQAVAVCLYEIARSQAAPTEPKRIRPAPMREIEQMTQMLLDASRRSGYMNPVVATSTENKVRRMVRRLNLSGRDVLVWMGMLRQILWKLGNSK